MLEITQEATDSDVLREWHNRFPCDGPKHRHCMASFLTYMGESGRSAIQATTRDISLFLGPMERGQFLTHKMWLRKFFDIACDSGLRSDNPVDGVKGRKKVPEVQAALTLSEMASFLDKLRSMARSEDARGGTEVVALAKASAVYELIYSSGLTMAQIAKIRRSDLSGGLLTVALPRRAGNRQVPVTECAIAAVRQWERVYRAETDNPSEWLFDAVVPSKEIAGHRLDSHVRRSVTAACKATGVRITAEIVRYSMARHLVDAGMQKVELAYLLGYRGIRYLEVRYPALYPPVSA